MTKDSVTDEAERARNGVEAAPPAARALTDVAQRALAEAAQRRKAPLQSGPVEVAGRGGLEPVRYGDWEVKGIATDF